MDEFLIGVFVVLFAISCVILGYSVTDYSWKKEVIERGYASYCPVDGKWAWNGECE